MLGRNLPNNIVTQLYNCTEFQQFGILRKGKKTYFKNEELNRIATILLDFLKEEIRSLCARLMCDICMLGKYIFFLYRIPLFLRKEINCVKERWDLFILKLKISGLFLLASVKNFKNTSRNTLQTLFGMKRIDFHLCAVWNYCRVGGFLM